ncbi:hypothetical protein K461DRAFT_248901 [Myriangium duriaei CBS 260.36]|uniref:Cadmium resistance transporter n=1 Tax=Myriangium duriaei CBS 260.36 TaxID=1168546 RepID=A0A9P4MBZ5_9PEZI|nr:hypothetical protein K461DRAFT_248901 [Myriangium duriaei CBS 260.36]
MIGFGVSLVLPSEPIGFLGLLPVLLGVWKFFGLVFPRKQVQVEEGKSTAAGWKGTIKVASITVMNGGDNIGTYIPLFSQAKKSDIAVYVIVYYILLGLWCLVAFLIMKQRHILSVAEKYAGYVIPFLYIGLGIYIMVKSSCYPWSIDKINNSFLLNPGETIMAVVTALVLLVCIGAIIWFRLRQRAVSIRRDAAEETEMIQPTGGTDQVLHPRDEVWNEQAVDEEHRRRPDRRPDNSPGKDDDQSGKEDANRTTSANIDALSVQPESR